MKVLRLRIYQPQAHYRVPFTYQRRHTYPIPPYSTVIGFLCNVLGIDDQSKAEYLTLKSTRMSIAGRFESKTTEYIWFRNLSKPAHVARFGDVENRTVGGHIEHIGGQSPVLIDVLNEVHLLIYLSHIEEKFLEEIKSSLENPVRRLEILHLGRAEDWIVFEDEPQWIDVPDKPKRRDANYRHFFWVPHCDSSFATIDGLLYRLPTFWRVQDFDRTLNRHGIRNFDFISVKLNDGLLVNQQLLIDETVKPNGIPVFLADFTKERVHESNMGQEREQIQQPN
jgi:CRISPR-associated protein Cas5t